MKDSLEELVGKAHEVFSKTSIFDVVDLDRATALFRLIDEFGPPDVERINRYFAVLDEVWGWNDPPGQE